ncbi:putative mitochondrial protein, partial [Mucuna pruriens]
MNKITPWSIDICNFIFASKFPLEASMLYKEKTESDAKYYIWDDLDSIVIKSFAGSILHFCHSSSGGGHYGSTQITREVLNCGFYWPTIFRDTHQFVFACKQCQRAGMAISRSHEMPQQPILFCEVFDV